MAGISGSPDVTVATVVAEPLAHDRGAAFGRVAGLSIGIGTWMVGALYLVLWAVAHGEAPDPPASVYIIPFYLGLAALAVVSIALVLRAWRRGRTWRTAFPEGYGVVGAGLVALLIGLVADVGWREGVGPLLGIAGLLGPTRVLVLVGVALVVVGPLRWALDSSHGPNAGWSAVLSASLLVAVLWLPGGFAPTANPWLERAPVTASSEIWVMDPDGANQTRLIETHDDVMAWNPVWSPDGTRIAFTRLVLGSHPPVEIPDEADIWVANADGSDAHALVARPDWQWIPHWSPDGAWIVYTDEPEGGPWASAGPAGLGGGGILGTGFGFGSSNPVRSYADIWRVRADGTGAAERITSESGDDRAATYSPDGTRLAFDSTRAGGTDIWLMNADGSDPRQLTFDHGFTWGATWSPDGSRIVFNSWRSNNQDLYLMHPDGGGTTRLTTDPAQELEPSWSADGTRVLFRRVTGDDGGQLWSVAADGTDEHPLSRAPRLSDDLTSGGGAWRSDGRIAFVRAADAPANAHPLVREDLAVAAMLLSAMALVFIAVLLASVQTPFGAIALLISVPTVIQALATDQSRFIPSAILGGLIVDVLIRLAPRRWKLAVAGAGTAVAFVVGVELTVALTGGVGWSASLLAGVVVAAAVVGWGHAGVVGRLRTTASEIAS